MNSKISLAEKALVSIPKIEEHTKNETLVFAFFTLESPQASTHCVFDKVMYLVSKKIQFILQIFFYYQILIMNYYYRNEYLIT